MKLEDIYENWAEDSKIKPTELHTESLRTPQLHSKYIQFFNNERKLLKKLRIDLKSLYLLKYEYYTGVMDIEDIREKGWEPLHKKILKSDADKYIEADKDYMDLNLRIVLAEEKVEALESILKTINNRGFAIKNAIDWMKFSSGEY